MQALLLTMVMVGWVNPAGSAGFRGSPIAWSQDGRWLVFLDRPSGDGLGDRRYRIWAFRVETKQTVLIDESVWPLTAPVWDPRGRTLAYGRFRPSEDQPARMLARGRYELVLRDGLERERVFVVKAPFVLDPGVEENWGLWVSAWSVDGLMLALAVPGEVPGLAVFRVAEGRVEVILAGASDPSWSPDGRRLAMIGVEGDARGLFVVDRKGLGLSRARKRLASGVVWGAPRWAREGGAIYVARSKPGPRGGEVELVSVVPDRDSPTTVLAMGMERNGDGGEPMGAAFDVELPGERCLFAARSLGDETAMVWGSAADHHVYKRFHPIDPSLGITTIALSPGCEYGAFRVDGNEGFGCVGLVDPSTEATWLIAPDRMAAREWRSVLAGRARRLLVGALAQATPDGEPLERPGGLPVPGELDTRPDLVPRLVRLARLGGTLGDPDSAADLAQLQDRLFLEYLGGERTAALATIDRLWPFQETAGGRAELLTLKAQVYWGAGERAAATALLGALRDHEGDTTATVEETPLGLVVSRKRGPRQAWLNLAASRLEAGNEQESAGEGLGGLGLEPGLGEPLLPGGQELEPNAPARPDAPRRAPVGRSR